MNGFEEKAFLARISDMIDLCERRGMSFTHFLNERQQAFAETELKRVRYENYCFFGGIDNADRRMLCIYSDYCRPKTSDFPLSCITFRYRHNLSLSHRDILGTLMAAELKREAIGDILVGEGITQAFVINSVKQVIGDEVRKIRSVGVSVSLDEQPILEKSLSYKEINGTAASMRLDCIIGLALGLSRNKSVTIISSGMVEVNYRPVSDVSFQLNEDDIFSVRGYGKFRIGEMSGISKKGRIHISVLKYC